LNHRIPPDPVADWRCRSVVDGLEAMDFFLGLVTFCVEPWLIPRILIFSVFISCLMFSSLAALSMVLTYQHATLTGTFLLPNTRISLYDDLRCLAISPAELSSPTY